VQKFAGSVTINLEFKVTIFFNVKYLENGTRQSYILTEENLVHMDRLRDDNVQEILGAIGPFWAKWGARSDESRGT